MEKARSRATFIAAVLLSTSGRLGRRDSGNTDPDDEEWSEWASGVLGGGTVRHVCRHSRRVSLSCRHSWCSSMAATLCHIQQTPADCNINGGPQTADTHATVRRRPPPVLATQTNSDKQRTGRGYKTLKTRASSVIPLVESLWLGYTLEDMLAVWIESWNPKYYMRHERKLSQFCCECDCHVHCACVDWLPVSVNHVFY